MTMLRSAEGFGSVIRMSPVAAAEPRRLYVYSPLVNADDNVPPLFSCVDNTCELRQSALTDVADQ